MNNNMFGTLPDGTLYTKRRNLWTRPKVNVVTYKGFDTGFMNWSNGWVYRKLNSETTHVGVCFRKADGSAITPEDVTNVPGGVLIWLP